MVEREIAEMIDARKKKCYLIDFEAEIKMFNCSFGLRGAHLAASHRSMNDVDRVCLV